MSTYTDELCYTESPFDLEGAEHSRLMAKRFFPPYIRRVGQLINNIHRIHPPTACRLTMGVLSVALPTKLKSEDKAFYKSGKAQLHTCGKHQFYTYAYGKGPKILLLHGWCSKGARWANYVEQITQAGLQAIVMDAPSHGQSPGRFLSVPDYIKCVKQVLQTQSDWYAIVGHSMGSLTGIIAANDLAQTRTLSKCVLMNTFSNCDALMSKFARCLGVSETVLVDTRQWITQYTGSPLAYFTLSNHLKPLNTKNLLVADKNDIVVPSREIAQIVNEIPAIEVIITDGLGHNLRCEYITKQVVDFVVA